MPHEAFDPQGRSGIDDWCVTCQQAVIDAGCACAASRPPRQDAAARPARVPERPDDVSSSAAVAQAVASRTSSRWHPSETSHGVAGRLLWSVAPLGFLSFWAYVGLFQNLLALLVLGPIMVAPNIWLLTKIWRTPKT